ncbi:hypothetical protein Tco_1061124 [Tanacetum coccineum]
MENANPPSPPESPNSFINRKVREFNTLLESLNLVAPPLDREPSCLEGEIGFVKLFKEYEIVDVRVKDEEEIKEEEEVVEVEKLGVEYFDKFPTKDELAYHKYLLHDPSPPFYRRCLLNVGGNPSNMKIPCNTGHDIGSAIDSCLSHVLLGKPFVEVSNMTYDPPIGIVKFTDGLDEVSYQMPHKIKQFRPLLNIVKEHKQSVYFKNDEDKRRGVDYVMKKIFGFYKECLELGPEYKTNNDGSSNVTGEGVT